jgi:phenylpyruvate tautomerase
VIPPSYSYQTSLDNINPEKNEGYSKDLFAILNEELGVGGDRGYM